MTRWRGAVPVIAGVQASALALLASIAVDDELEVRLMGCGALPLALAAMEAHLGAAPLWAGGPSSGAACTRPRGCLLQHTQLTSAWRGRAGDPRVQVSACRLLYNLTFGHLADVLEAGAEEAALQAITRFPDEREVRHRAAELAGVRQRRHRQAEEAAELRRIENEQAELKSREQEEAAQKQAEAEAAVAQALQRQREEEEARVRALQAAEAALSQLKQCSAEEAVQLLRDHCDGDGGSVYASVARVGCARLVMLSMEADSNDVAAVRAGGVEAVVHAMSHHPTKPRVAEAGCAALVRAAHHGRASFTGAYQPRVLMSRLCALGRCAWLTPPGIESTSAARVACR